MSSEQCERRVKFHDIIIHDNTAKTNKYNYPLSLFILIDNYNKSRLAAQAFIQDKNHMNGYFNAALKHVKFLR